VKEQSSSPRLKQSIAPFVFGVTFSHTEGIPIAPGFFIQFRGGLSLDDTCRIAAEIGFKGYDLMGPQHWPTLKKYGLIPTMSHLGSAGAIHEGFGSKQMHDKLEASTRAGLKECAAHGVPNIVAMPGPPTGMTYEEGADNTVEFFNRVKAQAEDLGVTICMELLNRLDHPNYLFDHAKWGFEVAKRVNSPRVKVLYDIYHAQIQDGDIVRTIRDNISWIGHIHTAGNPGRHQIDDEQELNYRFIARVIAGLQFTGYVGHEYMVREESDPVSCLKEAFEMFDLPLSEQSVGSVAQSASQG
jgi:hydroxypyruvate isomerase